MYIKKPKYTRVCKKVKRVATRFVREKVVRPMCSRSPMLLFKLKKIIYDLHLYRLRKQIRMLRRQKQRDYELECVTNLLQLSIRCRQNQRWITLIQDLMVRVKLN